MSVSEANLAASVAVSWNSCINIRARLAQLRQVPLINNKNNVVGMTI